MKPPRSMSAECSTVTPRFRLPSVKREALCTFSMKTESSFVVSTVEPVRFRPRVSASKHTLSHYRSWAASLTEEAPLVVLHNDALISDGEKMNDPAMQLLFSFGYETFDYTKDKQVPAARPAPDHYLMIFCLADSVLMNPKEAPICQCMVDRARLVSR